ncbi:MAG: EAL domain-containing protein [Pseudomonadales bacterium]|jgi:diguanylate cyclase (GGDEF)-like protein/PAS domain S-box-containing protein|nr:EAL domain-containing protein [Pseudomonadales bacterium]
MDPFIAATLDRSALLTLVIDEQGRARHASPALLELLGASATTIAGRDALTLFHPDDRAVLQRRVREARNRGSGRAVRLPRLRLDTASAGPVWLQARVVRMDDDVQRGNVVLSAIEATAPGSTDGEPSFATMFATSRHAVLVTRAEDRVVVDFNEAFTLLTGWSRDEGAGQLRERLLPLADEADTQLVDARLEEAGGIEDLECATITRDGRLVEIALSARYADIDGDRCIIAVLRDLTEHRRTEMALAESEEKFARIFHSSPDAMSIVRVADGVIIDVNDGFTRLFERGRDAIVGRTVRELRPYGSAEDALHWLSDATQDRTNLEVELALPRGVIPALVSTTHSEINGEACAIALIKDMSELARARQALEDSERRFRGAFEHAPIGMMLVGPNARISQVNRTLCDLLGYGRSELVGRDPDSLVHEADREEHRRIRRELLGGEADEATLETRYLRRDGSVIWTNRHVVLQRATDGTPVHVIVQVQDITDLKTSRERMEKLAFYDTLTGLANRRLFTDRLQQAVRHAVRTGRPTALMYLDLDNFKRVNDSLGHEAGDELLRTVARRLQDSVRSEDTVGRFGGDEFTILLNEPCDSHGASAVAQKVLASLADPIMVSGHEFRVTTSIGLTLAPDDGTDPQTLLKNADLAMYRAKERGRDNYQFFSEALNERAMDRLIVENELRAALRSDEFELYFQPQVSVSSGEIIGLEALLRWRHPRRGLLAPGAFIRVAEESGLIVPLGGWSIRRACEQLAMLRQRTGADMRIAVNISARQFSDPSLPTTVANALETSGLPASALELEITETSLMHDVDEAIRMLEALKRLGLSLAVDDFGTGYSSLAYLKRLPLDRVKVDRTFVSDIPENEDDVAITSAVIAMAHQLKLDVIAEGVETRAQLDFLAAADCEIAQGYLFGQPMPYEDVEDAVLRLLRRPGAADA